MFLPDHWCRGDEVLFQDFVTAAVAARRY